MLTKELVPGKPSTPSNVCNQYLASVEFIWCRDEEALVGPAGNFFGSLNIILFGAVVASRNMNLRSGSNANLLATQFTLTSHHACASASACTLVLVCVCARLCPCWRPGLCVCVFVVALGRVCVCVAMCVVTCVAMCVVRFFVSCMFALCEMCVCLFG